ncbi:MAG: DUF4838 domain-containing protein [Clostridia bacterium]|nr:DUF4838 domain-containing protein [Clostridia bacterium]
MLKIYKITSDPVVDFAAEELKKYLRMMMTEGGDIQIAYDPTATEGFRLGLMQDMGLDVSDVENVELDDILYIDTDTTGGIIAGDNPRSVLLAVYEYLKKNGCRWLFPGVDGEYIPLKNIEPVKCRVVPLCRHRGEATEGANYQQNFIENIDLIAKLGLNCFMIEFRVPPYYDSYYLHRNNTFRKPEPTSQTTLVQWKRALECELEKRGLGFHDIGHSWTGDSFVDPDKTVVGWYKVDPETVSEETKQYLALLNGKRGFYNDVPAGTNFCMSNPEARKKVCDFVVRYTKSHANSDYIHVWLADAVNNFCECEACSKKTPSDWYVVLMNDLDRALTEAGLTNRVGMAVYVDTIWAPTTETFNNPDRFLMILGPITRTYATGADDELINTMELPAYELNKSDLPNTIDGYIAHAKNWKAQGGADVLAFEYHFWRYFVHSAGGISIAKRAFDDARSYHKHNLDGVMQDGSQRAFFPNGFAFYANSRAIFDADVTFEEVAEDYFSHCYGKDWKQFYEFFENVEKLLPQEYLCLAGGKKHYVDPDMAKHIAENMDAVLAQGKALVESHYNSDVRVQTAAVRIMEYYLIYVEYYAKMMLQKALGNDDEAMKIFEAWRDEFSKYEIYMETCYDQHLLFSELGRMASRKEDSVLTAFYV